MFVVICEKVEFMIIRESGTYHNLRLLTSIVTRFPILLRQVNAFFQTFPRMVRSGIGSKEKTQASSQKSNEVKFSAM